MEKKYYYKNQKVKAHKRTTPKSNKQIEIKSYPRRQKFRKYSKITKLQAQELFDKKSQRSQNMDLKKTSNKVLTIPDERWAENTGRSDIYGIDTKPEFQDRFLLYANFVGKEPEDVKSTEYLSFMGKVLAEYGKSGRDKNITDQEDLTKFIKEYIKKNKTSKIPTTKGYESLLRKDQLNIDDKVYRDEIVINLENNIPQLKRSLGRLNKDLTRAEHRQLHKETIEKIKGYIKDAKEEIEEYESKLEKRIETIRETHTKKLLKLKTHYGMGVEGEIGFADNWKPKKKSEYLLDNRPIDIGTVPDSDKIIKSENWRPSKDNNFTFGSVQYADNLTFDQIYKYELRPKDEVEYANYMFWLKSDKDLTKAEKTKKRYLALSLKELEEWRNRDPFSNYAYILKTNMKKEKTPEIKPKPTPKKKKLKEIKFENLPNKDKLAINEKVYEDEAVANLDKNIELMKREIGQINRRVSKAEHRQLPKETMDKLYKNQLDYKKDMKDAEKQLEDRINLLIKKYIKTLKPKLKEDMTLTENEYAMSKLGGSSDKRTYKEYLGDTKTPRDDYGKYYEKIIKKNDRISQPKLKKLKEQILELERKGNRNSRFDLILQYPKGDQKELVEKYQKAMKKYTYAHSRDYDLKLQKRFKQIKKLPVLKSDQKYYVVMVRESGWVDHIAYKTKKEDAVNELEINDIIFKELRKDVKGKVEIVLAKNIEDVRKQIRSRGRENYLITGDTYNQKGKIRDIARVKFDYGKKGYIGELSPKELEKMNQLTGIEIKKVKTLTKGDLDASKIAKAHSKSIKYVRHKRVKGSIWQEKEPFTKEQNALEDSLTWIFKIGDDRNRLNTNFDNYINIKEEKIKASLNLQKIEDAPEDVLNAYDRYRKAVYNKILSDLNANRIAPSTVITGGSNYRGNMPKRERIERNAYERFQRVNNAVDKVIKQYRQL